LPNLCCADVAVIDDDVRQRGLHCPLQQGASRDAVGRSHVLIDLYLLFQDVAIFRVMDAVEQDLGLLVIPLV
jgi:hypothetical protein